MIGNKGLFVKLNPVLSHLVTSTDKVTIFATLFLEYFPIAMGMIDWWVCSTQHWVGGRHIE